MMLEARLNTRALAGAMAENIRQGFYGDEDRLEAARKKLKHKKGCNQHKDQPGCLVGNKGQTENNHSEQGLIADDKNALNPLTTQKGKALLQHPKENWKDVYKKWLLDNGKDLKTKTGETVSADEMTFNHIMSKDAGERNWRFRTMPLSLQAITEAEEVWQGYKGNKVHIALLKVKDVPHFVVAVTNGKKIISFYVEKKDIEQMENYRKGKLLYKEKGSK